MGRSPFGIGSAKGGPGIRACRARGDILIRGSPFSAHLPGEGPMADADLVDLAVDVARSKGATYAEARYERQAQESFILKNGGPDPPYSGDDQGIGGRVLVDGGPGFAPADPPP